MTIKKCDVCGAEISPPNVYNMDLLASGHWYLDEYDERFDLCVDCYQKIKTTIFEMTKETKK